MEPPLADIDRAVELLAATQAQVFLANLPNPTDLPFFRAKRARLAEQGLTENAERVFAAIDEGVLAGNARLSLQADAHHNVHVVDVTGRVSRWVTDGVRVDDATLWVQQYGGLIGLDGLHFSDTAYALVAHTRLDRLSEVFDVALERIDVGQVGRQDRERPEALSEDGLEASACQGDLASP